ncbi:Protein of unknown function [Saccharopolyspora kobensis]|uniref:DUF3558 domain-containing protein n=1 Tax=Saccharopolyspora kobensis TaxID=146035 RepID=A0A1H6BY33_9PSEU|nr:DUF3558 domain-containing protein [Saccharopolyspora kobensis]SEG65345.1 Protein of unknown function [Saccharopolyspora kobensis]SFC19681.1 Protein of unknown function [Saccharopolyspora kobensis]
MLKRGAVLGASLVMAVLLAACGTQTPEPGGEQPSQSTPPASGTQISNPKDAATVPPCDLLPPDAATGFGLELPGDDESDDSRRACGWYSADQSESLGLAVLPDRPLSSYLDNRTQFADFAELTIAGHPAVRANRNDPKTQGTCDIFLATKENEILSSQTYFSDKSKDACGLAQQALEAAVPALPSAK